MQKDNKIAIVGSGPVGSALSILLAREGYQVEIYEKRIDPTLGSTPAGRSVNLALTKRAIKALDMIGARERVLSHAIPMYGRTSHNNNATHYHNYGRENDCNYSISRHLLNNLLIQAAKDEPGVTVLFNQNLLTFDIDKTTLTFATAEGQSVTRDFQMVFAADGAFSAIRKRFITMQDFNYSQEYSDYGYLEFEIPANQDGGFVYHTNSFHLWPRFRSVMLAMANTDGSFTGNLFLPLKGPDSFESLAKEQDFVDFMYRQFPDAAPLMPGMLDTIRNGPRGRLCDIKCYPWVVQNFVLIGDAAHAIFPFYGQGLNAGLEDCTTLIQLIREHNGDWPTITSKYQISRKINTDAISDLSKQNFVELRDKMADPEFLMKKFIISYLSDHYNDIYTSQYSMISFSHTQYHLANAFGKVEDQIIKEIKQLPDYKEKVSSKNRYPEIEEILKKYQGLYELPSHQLDSRASQEQILLPNVGIFEVHAPILCSRDLYFEGNERNLGFNCYDSGLAKKVSPYQYDSVQVEQLTLCAHLHMTHAETECHIKIQDGLNIIEKQKKFNSRQLALALEVRPLEGQLEVSLDLLMSAYNISITQINSQSLRNQNDKFKMVIIKFLYDENLDENNKNITNFPYLSCESVKFLREKGFNVISINTPSFDMETTKEMENHHLFFDGANDKLLIELIDSSQVLPGPYVADIGIYPLDSDAAPCILKLQRISNAYVQ
ncbi:kynurenine 3-monooxygenase [Stylonychia lemnae]|uniref:Kynurenine 3-monooxygenase n=1 Tax=Stylonychia lemnae TaxID=5949 RepID=A0A078A348_STYLE|nr:kynurenine 3-monooxygenase [Stylonychia lemnae]|eukprot:CDW76247.1 kynurenine 3-monooxygenase [Stylonychia lemnae]